MCLGEFIEKNMCRKSKALFGRHWFMALSGRQYISRSFGSSEREEFLRESSKHDIWLTLLFLVCDFTMCINRFAQGKSIMWKGVSPATRIISCIMVTGY